MMRNENVQRRYQRKVRRMYARARIQQATERGRARYLADHPEKKDEAKKVWGWTT